MADYSLPLLDMLMQAKLAGREADKARQFQAEQEDKARQFAAAQAERDRAFQLQRDESAETRQQKIAEETTRLAEFLRTPEGRYVNAQKMLERYGKTIDDVRAEMTQRLKDDMKQRMSLAEDLSNTLEKSRFARTQYEQTVAALDLQQRALWNSQLNNFMPEFQQKYLRTVGTELQSATKLAADMEQLATASYVNSYNSVGPEFVRLLNERTPASAPQNTTPLTGAAALRAQFMNQPVKQSPRPGDTVSRVTPLGSNENLSLEAMRDIWFKATAGTSQKAQHIGWAVLASNHPNSGGRVLSSGKSLSVTEYLQSQGIEGGLNPANVSVALPLITGVHEYAMDSSLGRMSTVAGTPQALKENQEDASQYADIMKRGTEMTADAVKTFRQFNGLMSRSRVLLEGIPTDESIRYARASLQAKYVQRAIDELPHGAGKELVNRANQYATLGGFVRVLAQYHGLLMTNPEAAAEAQKALNGEYLFNTSGGLNPNVELPPAAKEYQQLLLDPVYGFGPERGQQIINKAIQSGPAVAYAYLDSEGRETLDQLLSEMPGLSDATGKISRGNTILEKAEPLARQFINYAQENPEASPDEYFNGLIDAGLADPQTADAARKLYVEARNFNQETIGLLANSPQSRLGIRTGQVSPKELAESGGVEIPKSDSKTLEDNFSKLLGGSQEMVTEDLQRITNNENLKPYQAASYANKDAIVAGLADMRGTEIPINDLIAQVRLPYDEEQDVIQAGEQVRTQVFGGSTKGSMASQMLQSPQMPAPKPIQRGAPVKPPQSPTAPATSGGGGPPATPGGPEGPDSQGSSPSITISWNAPKSGGSRKPRGPQVPVASSTGMPLAASSFA